MRICAVWAILVVNTCHAQPWALRDVSPRSTARQISILQMHFQELKYGHEGPDYFSVDRAPFAGKRELVEATLFGQEELGTVRFELILESGQRLTTLPAFRIGDGADADEYLLSVDVPRQPFRFQIQGEDRHGQPYRNVFSRLYVPVEGSTAPLNLPAGFTPEQSLLVQSMIDASAQETRARFEAALREHPDGTIRIPRSIILAASYEPLVSPLGNTLGMRVSFAVRFEQGGNYALSPHVFPLYANFQWRGQAAMKVLDGQVDPVPSPTTGTADGIADALRYGGQAHYEPNVNYRFTFDLVPDYVIRNADGTRYCIYSEAFRAGGRMAVWEAIQKSTAPIKYRVDVSSLDFVSETATLPPHRIYYEGLLREGARDCGPTPNIQF